MERNEFLAKLGMGIAAVCTGCSLVSCGSKGGDPKPGGGGNPPPGGGGPLVTANLESEITGVGQSKVSGGVILVRLAAGNAVSSFTAVQVSCTHEGTSINYSPSLGHFKCPNHGSEFSTDGAVLLGPAARPLKEYAITIEGSMLTVK